jgi:hypothetical protein
MAMITAYTSQSGTLSGGCSSGQPGRFTGVCSSTAVHPCSLQTDEVKLKILIDCFSYCMWANQQKGSNHYDADNSNNQNPF